MQSRKTIAQLAALALVACTARTASAQEDWELGDPGQVEEPAQEPPADTSADQGTPAEAADEPAAEGIATPYAGRGITLSEGTLRVDIGPYEHGLNDSGAILGPLAYGGNYGIRVQHFGEAGSNDNATFLGIGASYGVFDELEVGAVLLPILLSPRGDFADMALYGRYAFFRNEWVEVGGQLAMSFPSGAPGFGLGIGAPVTFRFIDRLRIDTGLELEMRLFRGGGNQYVGLDIPVAATYNITDSGFVGGHFAFTIYDFDGLMVPLGVHGGYTLFTDAVAVDFTLKASFFLATPDSVDRVTPEFQFIFGANLHFDVGPHREG